jgi:hypothetical protein
MRPHSFTGKNRKNCQGGGRGLAKVGALAAGAKLIAAILRVTSPVNRDFVPFSYLFQCAPAEGYFRQ